MFLVNKICFIELNTYLPNTHIIKQTITKTHILRPKLVRPTITKLARHAPSCQGQPAHSYRSIHSRREGLSTVFFYKKQFKRTTSLDC